MENKKDLTRVFSNTVMLYIVQISNYVFPLLTFPYLTRVLGTEKYGIVVFTNAVMMYFQTLIEFGFLLSATKDCSLARNDKTKLQNIVSSVMQAKFCLAIAGFGILFALSCFVPTFAEKRVFLLLSYLPLAVNVFLADYLFRGMEQMQVITTRMLSAKIIYTVLIFLIVKKGEDYLWIPLITAIGNIVIVLWTWQYVIQKWKIYPRFTGLKNTWNALKDSAVFFLSRIASTVYSSSNVVVLGMFFPDAAMGIFGTANNLISNGRLMFSPIADSIYPYMIKERNYKLVKKILIVLMPLIVIGTIGLYILAEPIIVLVCGEAFRESYHIFRAMLPLILIALPTYLLGYPVLGAMGKMKEANFSVIAASIFHVTGLGILILAGRLEFIPVSFLTVCTEMIVLTMRLYYIMSARKKRGESK